MLLMRRLIGRADTFFVFFFMACHCLLFLLTEQNRTEGRLVKKKKEKNVKEIPAVCRESASKQEVSCATLIRQESGSSRLLSGRREVRTTCRDAAPRYRPRPQQIRRKLLAGGGASWAVEPWLIIIILLFMTNFQLNSL